MKHGDDGSDANETVGDDLSDDEMYFLLSSKRRRLAIREVCEADGPLKRSELTTRVTEGECGPDYTPEDRSRVHISLYQAHLDKLCDAGVLINDDPYVSAGPNAPKIYRHVAPDESGVRKKLTKLFRS